MSHIYKCSNCNEYTLREVCPKCGEKTKLAYPPKYSPQDKYGKYRREVKFKSGGDDAKI